MGIFQRPARQTREASDAGRSSCPHKSVLFLREDAFFDEIFKVEIKGLHAL